MNDNFFKLLTQEQESEFRQWARDNFEVENKKALDANVTVMNPLWHPVIRDEFRKLIIEKYKE